jgi:hypothetical protein
VLLLDFAVNGVFFEEGVILLQLDPFGGVLFVFNGAVSGNTFNVAPTRLGALEDDLDAVIFFCHGVTAPEINFT